MLHGREPTLDEILNEPIIRKVMAVDGYTADDIRYLIRQAGARKPFMKILKPSRANQQIPHPAIPVTSVSACRNNWSGL
jgi:hypothetical protein